MKKLRLTPLNIVIALALVLLMIMLFQPSSTNKAISNFNGLYQLILAALIVVCFIADMIFRFTIKNLKRIWFVETFFIALTVILFLILQK